MEEVVDMRSESCAVPSPGLFRAGWIWCKVQVVPVEKCMPSNIVVGSEDF